jgi:hypothetical protein
MFRAFPRGRSEWLQLLVFPFQAYVVVAIFVEKYFMRSLDPHSRGSLAEFKFWVMLGYAACFLALLTVGIAQLCAGRRRLGIVNLCLAALSVLVALSLANFVYT